MSETIQTIDFMDGTKIVLTADDGSGYRTSNLAAINAAGAEIWRAALPENTGPDAYLDVRFENGVLLANTWSGNLVQLSPTTGAVEGLTFIK